MLPLDSHGSQVRDLVIDGWSVERVAISACTSGFPRHRPATATLAPDSRESHKFWEPNV